MAGAVPMASLGVGFVVNKHSARVFLKKSHNDTWYLCERESGAMWSEIIAEFRHFFMAEKALKDRRKRR